MILVIDVTTLPPIVKLVDEQDFGSFKVLVSGEHTLVTRDELIALAGPVADDDEWRSRLDAMIEYAKRSGWVSADGAVRAHVELDAPTRAED